MGTDEGRILFLSPKIQRGGIDVLNPAIEQLNRLFAGNHFGFQAKVYYGAIFKQEIINPIIELLDDINDTSELFLRSAQMLNMFELVQNIETDEGLERNLPNAANNRQRKVRVSYILEGNSYTMGRLALEIVKNYVGNHPNITYENLKSTFQQNLCFNKKPIIRRVAELSESELNGQTKRAYTNADDLISVADANDVCVSSQWSKEDMPFFLSKVRDLGFDVQEE
jgi:hypothetical protein